MTVTLIDSNLMKLMKPFTRQTFLESSAFGYFFLFGKGGILKCKRKNAAKMNGEPQAKRLKRSESSSSSSSSGGSSEDDDESSLDSESTFDIFSSDSNSESGESSYAENTNSDDEALESDVSEMQDDISIKDEPIFGSDAENHNSEEELNPSKKMRHESEPSNTNGNVTIKTEVLEGIVDAVEVDSSALLCSPEIQVKEEPTEGAETKEDAVEVKEETETGSAVGPSSDILETSQKS